jgi:hypothetical protein
MGLAELACCAFERGGMSGVVLDATMDAGAAFYSAVDQAVASFTWTLGRARRILAQRYDRAWPRLRRHVDAGRERQLARGGPATLSLKSFGLGWLGLNDQFTAWFDDVALSSSRIGCP